jgi:hypothetical protein
MNSGVALNKTAKRFFFSGFAAYPVQDIQTGIP